jgi:hypothetical protein
MLRFALHGQGQNSQVCTRCLSRLHACVMFGAITGVGCLTCSVSPAVVADLPVPVAPSSTHVLLASLDPPWSGRRSPPGDCAGR